MAVAMATGHAPSWRRDRGGSCCFRVWLVGNVLHAAKPRYSSVLSQWALLCAWGERSTCQQRCGVMHDGHMKARPWSIATADARQISCFNYDCWQRDASSSEHQHQLMWTEGSLHELFSICAGNGARHMPHAQGDFKPLFIGN